MDLTKLKSIQLSGNAIKIIAALLMVVDHVGVIFFPESRMLRIIGRLSLPLFAFMISEGAKYTKNKLKYLLSLFVLGVICQLGYLIADGGLYMCIIVSFTLSLALIFLLWELKRAIFSDARSYVKILLFVALLAAVALIYYINTAEFSKRTGLIIDYGFWGIMLPLFASILDFRGIEVSPLLKKLDNIYARIRVWGSVY